MKKYFKKLTCMLITTAMVIPLLMHGTVMISASNAPTFTFPFKTLTEADHGIKPKEEENIPPENLPKPVIMDFSSLVTLSDSRAQLSNQAENQGGLYKYFTLEDGTKCLRISYSPYTQLKLASYRCNPSFYKSGMLNENYKYVRMTYMTDDPKGNSIVMSNPATGSRVTLIDNSNVSRGEWITTEPVDMSSTDIVEKRLSQTVHVLLSFNTPSTEVHYYLKELAFFATEQQAYDYYGDEPSGLGLSIGEMRFGPDGNGTTNSASADYGMHTISDDGILDITYAEKTNMPPINYMAKIKFKNNSQFNANYIYARVLYAADNPEGVESCSMFLKNDGSGECIRAVENVVDTNGKYVLSDPVVLGTTFKDRLKSAHLSLVVNANGNGGSYKIKAIYFFCTKLSADLFSLSEGQTKISINGNDISKYKIVTADDTTYVLKEAAEDLQKYIYEISGADLPIVSDTTPQTEYEILIGRSSRSLSYKVLDERSANINNYCIDIDNNTLIISSAIPGNTDQAVSHFLEASLNKGATSVPKEINITGKDEFFGTSTKLTEYSGWPIAPNVSDPDRFTDDFDSDDGYFTEENNAQNFVIKNGVMATTAKETALTYIHVYERNATVTARLKFSEAGINGNFGLMQHYTAADAWVRAGYNVTTGEWFIDNREGIDFNTVKLASVKMSIKPDVWYDVTFTVDGTSAYLYVNGVVVLTAGGITHKTPGRLAVYAEHITLTLDSYDAKLLSAEGTVMRNVVHTKLFEDMYSEGGSVTELKDGTLIYKYSKGTPFESKDNGKTWTETKSWAFSTSYPNIIRLNNGDLLKATNRELKVIAQISKDDGDTWTDVGQICSSRYTDESGKSAGGGNVNDKLFQSPTTNRIFNVQSYTTETPYPDGKMVFGEIFYSDDNGATWTKSETGTWEIEGNKGEKYFGECKVLECDDGTLRLYNSWNSFGCIVYSESTDNGKTWGPIVKIPELVCARSSMQFVRDPYAENNSTYYMVWVYSEPDGSNPMTRSRLSLAKSTDGKEWEYLGDIWRWESNYTANGGAQINHIVDPFVLATDEYIIVGTGLSEQFTSGDDYPYHQGQRQHIWSIQKDTLPEGVSLNKFRDVTPAAPYNDAVTFVSSEGLFQGTSDTTFSPADTMNRAMFVTVLGRLANVDETQYTKPSFSDVVAGQWYTPYVEWAAANGVVNGIGNNLYGVTDKVTIQQACVILARYANYATADRGTNKTSVSFADGAQVASWAVKEVDWAIANGIYNGTNGQLNPTAPASRAIVAVMFNNYVQSFGD